MSKITKRETLLECLDLMKKIRNSFSHKGWGMAPIERYTILFTEYDEKCQILREMVQALESEPVRKALANWQKEIMDLNDAEDDPVQPVNMLNVDRKTGAWAPVDEDNMNPINGRLE